MSMFALCVKLCLTGLSLRIADDRRVASPMIGNWKRRNLLTALRASGFGVVIRTRPHMGNSVDVNENEYAVSSFESRLAAVRKLESAIKK